MDLAKFLGCILKDSWAERYLSVCNQGNLFAFAHAQHCRAVKIVLSMRELVSRRECSIVLVRHHSCSLECYALGSSKIRDGGKFCPQGVHVGAKE